MTSRREFLAASAATIAVSAFGQTPGRSLDLANLSMKKAADLVRSKTATPTELTQACLQRIEKYNHSLNAYITTTAEQALAEARTLSDEQQRGKWRGPLHGVPIALKDNIDTAGIRTTAASQLFKDRIPTEDAEVVRRLKNAGAILLGKLNLHEFAYGGTSAVTYFGPVRNPWALDRTPGGSSGGPAAAVSADLCFGSLGTDTAGSIRLPASLCSIVGLKPTYGRVSNRGVIPLAWSLDHVGPMCKTVEDAALVLNVIAGYDEQETTSVDTPAPDYLRALKAPTSKLRLGIPRAPYFDALHPDIAKAMDAAIEVLRKLTASVADIRLPQASAGSILGVEAYAYHSQWFTKTPELYQPATRTALQRSADLKAEPYAQSLRTLAQSRRDIKKIFSTVDLLILPTLADPPFKVEEGLTRNISARNTLPFDVFGIPMISIPCGFTAEGYPIGLQIGGPPWAEASVLSLAYAYEQATQWHLKRPPL